VFGDIGTVNHILSNISPSSINLFNINFKSDPKNSGDVKTNDNDKIRTNDSNVNTNDSNSNIKINDNDKIDSQIKVRTDHCNYVATKP